MAQEMSEKEDIVGLQEDLKILEMTALAIGTCPRKERGATSAHRIGCDAKLVFSSYYKAYEVEL